MNSTLPQTTEPPLLHHYHPARHPFEDLSLHPGYLGCLRLQKFRTALPGFPHMQSGSSLPRLNPSRERMHNRCIFLVPLGFSREIVPLREKNIARILTTRDFDVIHVDSDHQRHLTLDHQPKTTRRCFALFETNLFY